MLKLVISDDEGKTTVVPLVRDEITIGRKEGNTIRLTERNVSRRHARISKRPEGFMLEDLASYNGIVLNGARLQEARSVKHGDHGAYLSMEPEAMQRIVKEHLRTVNRIRDLVRTPVVLTSPVVRLYYERLIRQFSAETVVLSYNEIEADVQVQSVANVAV